jgi:hypothetical protein
MESVADNYVMNQMRQMSSFLFAVLKIIATTSAYIESSNVHTI